jgi:uncharacterized protein (DUF2252 family)
LRAKSGPVGSPEIFALKDHPPLVFHPRRGDRTIDHVRQFLAQYRKTLPDDRRMLLERYTLVDVVVKVVGVGSVGTRCAVALLMARDDDSLLLQFKEARASVLEPYAGRSRYANHGQRVVEGQRLMQSASDIFLGWTQGLSGRHFYLRQIRDAKISAVIEGFDLELMQTYARLCAWALARAHARSGDTAMIAGYMGASATFDDAVGEFAMEYADQNECDYRTFVKAVKQGQIEVSADV